MTHQRHINVMLQSDCFIAPHKNIWMFSDESISIRRKSPLFVKITLQTWTGADKIYRFQLRLSSGQNGRLLPIPTPNPVSTPVPQHQPLQPQYRQEISLWLNVVECRLKKIDASPNTMKNVGGCPWHMKVISKRNYLKKCHISRTSLYQALDGSLVANGVASVSSSDSGNPARNYHILESKNAFEIA